MPALIGARRQAITLKKGVPIWDFRNGMPAGSTYTRTGAAIRRTLAALLQTVAANDPQRSDAGLALEPAATNVLLNNRTLSGWSVRGTGSITASAISSPDGTVAGVLIAGIGTASTNDVFIAPATGLSALLRCEPSFYIQRVSTSGVLRATNAWDTALGEWRIDLATLGAGWQRITRSHPAVTVVNEWSTTSSASGRIGWQFAAQSGAPLSFYADFLMIEPGTSSTSPIIAAGANTTRGLPVFTEPVPAGRTKARLTYADATTTLVTGLTPGGTFDYVTPILAASKGRFGASELITREWQA